MNKILFFLTATLFFTLTANGQRFFFIGENSYPCTETFTLQSNSDNSDVNDLKVLFAKDGATPVIIVSIKTGSTVRISEKLIIYLDDGKAISCTDKGINDNVDDIASTAYHLTSEDLIKMRSSNIFTIRYVIKCANCFSSSYEGNYSASNKGNTKTDFPTLTSKFFSK